MQRQYRTIQIVLWIEKSEAKFWPYRVVYQASSPAALHRTGRPISHNAGHNDGKRLKPVSKNAFYPARVLRGGDPALSANSLFEMEQAVSASVSAELTHVSPASALILFVAGVLTSLSPCALSVQHRPVHSIIQYNTLPQKKQFARFTFTKFRPLSVNVI
jgi:hypothetical protein